MPRGPRAGRSSGRRSYSSGWPKFRSSPHITKTSSGKTDKDEKKSPPPAKVETTTGESKPGRFYSTIADGFSWGTGNAMGHRFVEAIFGPRTIKTEVALPEKAEVASVDANDDYDKYKEYTESCSISYNAFQECLYAKGNNLRKCHFFMDQLFECKKNTGSFF
ncbi:unnamed protein product [Microthlaspi erraticum]|uniref:CHCH domain-containing protein n=1 Tax=Microthlaspi erraticum TaxID=1685480 RepID=A0A6D2IW66_9BRAS|nr:unnamed protein product [Microthlaspi erraticum]